jgi:large subunit ribosomal protein LP1
MSSKAEQAVAYAALILADDSIPITPEKLQTLLKAAGLEDVEPIWTTLFAKALEGKDVKDGEGAEDGEKVKDEGGDDEGSDDDDLGLGLFD